MKSDWTQRTIDTYAACLYDDKPKCLLLPLLTDEFTKVANNLTGGDCKSIIKSLETASAMAVDKINKLAKSMDGFNVRKLLATFVAKQLSPTKFGPDPQSFTETLCDAVLATVSDCKNHRFYTSSVPDFEDGSDLIGITKLPGATLRDSFYVEGVACKKTHSTESMSLCVENPIMLMLNLKLDPKSRHSDPYQSKHDKKMYDMLDKYVDHSANVVLSCQEIGDIAKQYFAEKGITCVGQFDKKDLDRAASATGTIVTPFYGFVPMTLGTCQLLKEEQFGNEELRVFTGCSGGKRATVVLRGTDECIEEVMAHIYELIVSLRSFMKDYTVVAVGPALYRRISRHVSKEAHNVPKVSHQPFIKAFAKAFKAVSHQVVGVGAPGPDVRNNPSQKHDIVYEPTSQQINIIRLATINAYRKIRYRYPTDDSNRKPAKQMRSR